MTRVVCRFIDPLVATDWVKFATKMCVALGACFLLLGVTFSIAPQQPLSLCGTAS